MEKGGQPLGIQGTISKNPSHGPWLPVAGSASGTEEAGSIHDVSGMSAFTEDRHRLLYAGTYGIKVSGYIFKILNPTINLQVGNFSDFPCYSVMKKGL